MRGLVLKRTRRERETGFCSAHIAVSDQPKRSARRLRSSAPVTLGDAHALGADQARNADRRKRERRTEITARRSGDCEGSSSKHRCGYVLLDILIIAHSEELVVVHTFYVLRSLRVRLRQSWLAPPSCHMSAQSAHYTVLGRHHSMHSLQQCTATAYHCRTVDMPLPS